MTVVISGKCVCNFVELGRHCAFNVVHIGKDRALGPDGENTSASTAQRAPLSCACGTMVLWSNERRGRARPVTLATFTTIAFRAFIDFRLHINSICSGTRMLMTFESVSFVSWSIFNKGTKIDVWDVVCWMTMHCYVVFAKHGTATWSPYVRESMFFDKQSKR